MPGPSNSNITDQAVWDIVENQSISDQHTLLAALAEKGFHITQSTLSRKLHKLGIRKQNGVYRKVKAEEAGAINPNLARSIVTSPPNLLLIKTLPGQANAVGYHLENIDMPGMAGTIAGNDTLLVAVRTPEELEVVEQEIVRSLQLEDR
jgi:transcriptional regulator of arginine metabolism